MDRATPTPDRRTVLVAGATALVAPPARGRDALPRWQSDALAYLAKLARDGGGYAWDGAPYAHLTPTFAAVGAHRVLKQEPPEKAALVKFVRDRHPFHIKKLERPLRG